MTCSIVGCSRSVVARTWCKRHYDRWRMHGDPTRLARQPGGRCVVGGCKQASHARGWCSRHYQRWKKSGDVAADTVERVVGDDKARFWSKVDAEGDCWEWTGARSDKGYGHMRRADTIVAAHRFAWELLVGPIPDGLEIDHLCRKRKCVNPDHLEPVTHSENMRRAGLARMA